ncbi:MAG: helix-turn-helix transcriptional regulator [Oscillospiraceae bacterium]|nr:helix-turn-helix transcriptional regulator [Oscillospiraceae bacterium]
MNDIKATVAKNIAQLRQEKNMTQLELAEHLNYSDKSVSKWERGDSLPDIAVLAEIAELFGVTLDYLVQETHPQAPKQQAQPARQYTRGIITGVSVLLVWLIAMLCYVVISLVAGSSGAQWLAFVYAVPVSMIVWLVFNSVWFNPRRNYLIISLLVWTGLAAIHISFLAYGTNIWLVYLLGIPGQLIILLWSRMRKNPPVIEM